MENFVAVLAERLAARSEGLSEFRDVVIESLEPIVKEFNQLMGPRYHFLLKMEKSDHEIELGNGYKVIKLVFDVPPGVIQVRRGDPETSPTHFLVASIRISDEGFVCDQIPSECSDPAALSEWMVEDLFEL